MNTAKHETGKVDVRETMRTLPEPFQPAVTWITGRAYAGQLQMWQRSPLSHMVTALLGLFGGATLSASIIGSNLHPLFWVLLVPSWMFTVGGARKLLTSICHACVHQDFTRNKAADRFLAEAISTLLMLQDHDGYHADHVTVHHSKQLATLDDPDLKFLITLGFLPGMRRKELWLKLVKTCFSPQFHYLFIRARLRANFKTAPLYRRLMAVAYNGLVLFFVALTNSWLVFLWSWIFPLTLVYHCAALLQFVCEHQWLRENDPGEPAKLVLARLTSGRFLGESAPQVSGSRLHHRICGWLWWLARMALIHLPGRVFVLPGELPVHDYHHRHPKGDWANGFYARQRDIEAGCPGWPEEYTEVWGLGNAIDGVFRLISSLPPLTETPTPMPLKAVSEVLNGM